MIAKQNKNHHNYLQNHIKKW